VLLTLTYPNLFQSILDANYVTTTRKKKKKHFTSNIFRFLHLLII